MVSVHHVHLFAAAGKHLANSIGDEMDMTTRDRLERIERDTLSPLASLSERASRVFPETPSSVRTAFQRDRDRVIHAKSFRRLMHKTQVYIGPSGDHYRTRLTHTLEVAQIARTIGRALRLNEDLIEAIGMAHDLGHTPFGHAGETALAEVFPGFRHNEQSLRVVDLLEKDGEGLNLTNEVRDGILRHSKPRSGMSGEIAGTPQSLEGQVLKLADAIAYINHDLDDAVRSGMIAESEVPADIAAVLGQRHASRINTLVCDVIDSSHVDSAPGEIRMSNAVSEAADGLRDLLFERVYVPLNERPDTARAQHLVRALFGHFAADPGQIPAGNASVLRDDSPERKATDFVSSMTDRFAVETFRALFVPRFWST